MKTIDDIKMNEDNILVKLSASVNKTDSGILIAKTESTDEIGVGNVIRIGEGFIPKNAEVRNKMTVEVNDKVYFDKEESHPIRLDGDDYFVISERKVLMFERN